MRVDNERLQQHWLHLLSIARSSPVGQLLQSSILARHWRVTACTDPTLVSCRSRLLLTANPAFGPDASLLSLTAGKLLGASARGWVINHSPDDGCGDGFIPLRKGASGAEFPRSSLHRGGLARRVRVSPIRTHFCWRPPSVSCYLCVDEAILTLLARTKTPDVFWASCMDPDSADVVCAMYRLAASTVPEMVTTSPL